MLDNGLGLYGMSHVSMNIIQQIHDEACAIYQVEKVYSIYQSIKLQIINETMKPKYMTTTYLTTLPMVIRLDHRDHL